MMVEKMILKQMQATTGIEKFVMCSTTGKKSIHVLIINKIKKKMWPFLEYNLFDVRPSLSLEFHVGGERRKGFVGFLYKKGSIK